MQRQVVALGLANSLPEARRASIAKQIRCATNLLLTLGWPDWWAIIHGRAEAVRSGGLWVHAIEGGLRGLVLF